MSSIHEKLDNKIKAGLLYRFTTNYTKVGGPELVGRYIALMRSANALEVYIEQSIEVSSDKGKTFSNLYETKIEDVNAVEKIKIEKTPEEREKQYLVEYNSYVYYKYDLHHKSVPVYDRFENWKKRHNKF